MNEIYPMRVAAHGVMIVTPVNWYQVPRGFKAMIDRLVCADGGNPDPTSTGGKDAQKAKEIELKGWDYPRHLAGRASPWWCTAMPRERRPCGVSSATGYATWAWSRPAMPPSSTATTRCRRRPATPRGALVQAVKLMRRGKFAQPDARLREVRPK